MFLKTNWRPDHEAAAGSVTVQVEPDLLLISQFSLAATVKLAVLVTGAPLDALITDAGVTFVQ